MQDQIEGTAQKVTGKVQDAIGGLTDDTGAQLEGKARKTIGALQQSYGETLDNVRSVVADRPIGGLLVAAAVGFVLGAALTR